MYRKSGYLPQTKKTNNVFALTSFSLTTILSASPVVAADEVMVITASQTLHNELTAPASVSYITRDDLDKLVVTDLAEAVATLPGVNINPATTYGRNEIKIRGLDSDYTLILINGRRINSRDALTTAYGNDFDLSSIPLSAVERIEVIRGPMSALYGVDALGGVVNVILRQPSEQTQASIGYEYDSPTEGHGGESNRINGFVSGALVKDKLLANLIVEHNDRDAWRTDLSQNNETDALEERRETNLFGGLKWLINENQDLDLELIYNDDHRDADWNNWGNAVNNVQKLERTNAAVIHNGYWNAFDSRLRYSYERSKLNDDSELNGAVGHVTQTNQYIDGQVTALLGMNLVTAGAEYSLTDLKHNLTLADGPVDYRRLAVYLQDEIVLGDWAITLGGRYDDHEAYGGEFSPRGYVVYSLSDQWVIKGGAGKAFKAPSLNQYSEQYRVLSCRGACTLVGNPDLKAETAWSYELSTAYQSKNWGGGITFYSNDIDDMIQSQRWDRVATELTYFNIDKARVRGGETDIWFNVTEDLSVEANYMYTDAKNKTTNDDLTLTPKHIANLQLEWEAIERLSTYAAFRYTGSQFVRTNEKSKAYQTVDLGARYEVIKGLFAKLGVTNLTNEKRDDTATKYDYILKGRSVFAGINYNY